MGRGRPRQEPTRIRTFRLPERLWKLMEKASAKEYRSTNAQIRKMIEDYLIEKGLMGEDDRKRPYIRRDLNKWKEE